MKITLYTKPMPLLLLVIIICHVFQANSASFEPQKGTSFSVGRRILRTQLLSPPAPELGRSPISMFFAPPPPSSTITIRRITPVLRTIPKGSPPAPKLGRPRNFRGFLPSPQPPPPPPPPPPPKVPVYRRPSKCKIPPPPPAST